MSDMREGVCETKQRPYDFLELSLTLGRLVVAAKVSELADGGKVCFTLDACHIIFCGYSVYS